MLRRRLIVASFFFCSWMVMAAAELHAQVHSSALVDLQTAIIRGVGAQGNTLEAKMNGNVLVVLRINSNMNSASHDARDNEATAIASIVSKTIGGKPEFKKLIGLRVEYVTRAVPGGRAKVVDTIEFRETPAGTFEHHKT